ncbi:hypothetical protein M407DRAFT_242533 [Tulasnella calospora MUT 4182]|uniref:Uncharacterized protein n=1 Tax=Tulasnella calospora MUT 4182 TaxID=1051891 RepID=A0A0C3QNK5_9AGAM|nr:hypothetical protein M407DRAFT_242533 [Tulasnella calospora MUT 4182]
MATLARIYQSSFDRAPAQTLMFTNGCLSALGDVCAQSIELFSSRDLERKNYDPARTIRFIAFGVGMGPLIGRWNKFLEHAFPLRAAGGKVSFTSLAKRVAADQTMMAPVGMAIFVSSMGFMEGKNVTQVTQKYKDMFVPAMIANWKVWPAVQMVNFRFMPLPYRVPFQSTCGVFWTVYLSLLNSQAKER